MRLRILIILIAAFVRLNGQIADNKNFVWFTPSEFTRINGMSIGFSIQGDHDIDTLNTIVNGLCLELIGFGAILPLAPSSPIYYESDTFYYDDENLDRALSTYSYPNYKVNGLVLSGFGIAGQNTNVTGVNISGLFTLTGKVDGISLSMIYNITGISNGLSISGLSNNSLQTKGLQIALFNKTIRLRGIQVGLWNTNEKRSLPIINWNFKG